MVTGSPTAFCLSVSQLHEFTREAPGWRFGWRPDAHYCVELDHEDWASGQPDISWGNNRAGRRPPGSAPVPRLALGG
ncbi:hypothetical protein ACWD4P_34555 [Kitasatospora sp. NPDC002543]